MKTKSYNFVRKFHKALESIGLRPNYKYRSNIKIYRLWATSVEFVKWFISLTDKEKLRKFLSCPELGWEYIEGAYDSDDCLPPFGGPYICSHDLKRKKFLPELLWGLGVANSIQVKGVRIYKKGKDIFFSNIESCYNHRMPQLKQLSFSNFLASSSTNFRST